MPFYAVLVLYDPAQIIRQLNGAVDIEMVVVIKILVVINACFSPVTLEIDVVVAEFLYDLSRLVGALDALIGGGIDHVRHADKRHI